LIVDTCGTPAACAPAIAIAAAPAQVTPRTDE